MVEARGEPGLFEHSLAEPFVIGEAFVYRSFKATALEMHVERAIHLAHAAAPGKSTDLVAGDELTRRNASLYCHRPSRVVVAGARSPAPKQRGGRTRPAAATPPHPAR